MPVAANSNHVSGCPAGRDCRYGQQLPAGRRQDDFGNSTKYRLQRGAQVAFRAKCPSKPTPASKPRQIPLAITPVTASIAAV
jgi:hypothetical protein